MPSIMQPSHGGCLHHALMKGFTTMLGFDACSDSYMAYVPWVLISLLYLSAVIRYRGYTMHRYYKKHGAPTVYSQLTRVPWEAVGAFLVTIPRFTWAGITLLDAIFKHGAWDNASFSHWLSWGLVLYVGLMDAAERRLLHKRLWLPYLVQKHRDAEVVDIETVLCEEHNEKVASTTDMEKGALLTTVEQPQPDFETFFQRWRAAIFNPRWKPTACQVLANYHLLAFGKIFFSFVFFSEMALFACNGSPEQLLNSNVSIAPALFAIAIFSMARFGHILGTALAFSKEVDWDALERERA